MRFLLLLLQVSILRNLPWPLGCSFQNDRTPANYSMLLIGQFQTVGSSDWPAVIKCAKFDLNVECLLCNESRRPRSEDFNCPQSWPGPDDI